MTVGVAIRASSAIQNGPNYLETSIDCGSRYALGASIGDEPLKRLVMYPVELKCPNVWSEQPDVLSSDVG